jgi:hypothetical protein
VYPKVRGAPLKNPMVSFWELGKQEADTEEKRPSITRRKVKTRIEVDCIFYHRFEFCSTVEIC